MGLTAKQIREHGVSDIGSWGEKDQTGAYSTPLTIAGEKIELRDTPALSDSDALEMGDLQTDPGTAGDVYESAPRFAPRR